MINAHGEMTIARVYCVHWKAFAQLLASQLWRIPSRAQKKVRDAGKSLLELGCGSNPLCMLAALRNARLVVSTDGSMAALKQMADNISSNSRYSSS